MDKPISVGDLVMVVRHCCKPHSKWIGLTFIAGQANARFTPITICCRLNTGGPGFTDQDGDNWSSWFLKRIQPLDELEDVKRDEEITA